MDRSGKGGRGSSDLDPETLRELRSSNSKVKAMFEKNAPKYKFGGSGEKLLQEEDDDGGKDDDLMLRPRRGRGRQAQQQQKGQVISKLKQFKTHRRSSIHDNSKFPL